MTCPTDICNALCCRVAAPYPDPETGECIHLRADLLCDIEVNYGKIVKPWVCYVFPRTQYAKDSVNAKSNIYQCQIETTEGK